MKGLITIKNIAISIAVGAAAVITAITGYEKVKEKVDEGDFTGQMKESQALVWKLIRIRDGIVKEVSNIINPKIM